jgi:hypothetical protein
MGFLLRRGKFGYRNAQGDYHVMMEAKIRVQDCYN